MGKKKNEMEESMAEVVIDETNLVEQDKQDAEKPLGGAYQIPSNPAVGEAGTVAKDPMPEASGTVADGGDGKAAGSVGGNTTLSVEGGDDVTGGGGNEPTAEPSGTVAGGVNAAPVVLPDTLPGGLKANNTSIDQTNNASATKTDKVTSSSGRTVTSTEIDWPLYHKLMAEYEQTAPSAAKVVLDLFGDKIDENKVAAEKEDADRRRRRHEGVEAIRLMIEAATGAAKGRVIKRDKINYAQYEAEKEKVDATRRAALEKLYAAMAADDKARSDMKAKVMQLASRQVQTQEKIGQEQGGSTTIGQTNKGSIGHKEAAKTNINTGKQQSKYTYPLRVEQIGKDGKRNQRIVNLEFKNGKAGYDGYMTAAATCVCNNSSLFERAKKMIDKVQKGTKGADGKQPGLTDDQVQQILYNGYYTGFSTNALMENKAYRVDNEGLRASVLLELLNDSQDLRDIASGYIENLKDYDAMRQAAKTRPAGNGYHLNDEREKKSNGGAY